MTNAQCEEILKEHLTSIGCSYRENVNLKYLTYFKYGGTASLYLTPTSTSVLINVIQYLIKIEASYKIIGNTSNVIFLESGKYSIVLSTKFVNQIEVHTNYIECSAGVMLEDLVRIAILNQGKGFEGMEGIPGTVGGGIFMNAGAYGSSISDNLISVLALNKIGQKIELDKEQCLFSQRHSIFKDDPSLKIISAKFKIESENFDLLDVTNKAEVYHIARHSYQEFIKPNLGSMFTLKSCLYKKVLTKDIFRHINFFLIRLIYTNKLMKFIKRKKPSNKHLNNYFAKVESITYPYSHKSMNILINDGSITDIKLINHIIKMKSLVDDIGELENELIQECLVEIPPEIKNHLLKI